MNSLEIRQRQLALAKLIRSYKRANSLTILWFLILYIAFFYIMITINNPYMVSVYAASLTIALIIVIVINSSRNRKISQLNQRINELENML